MSSDREEFLAAIRAVEKEVGVDIDESLAEAFLSKIADKKNSGTPFGEAMRYSLNDLYVRGREKRQLLCRVAGKYFGPRGGRQAARNRRLTTAPKKKAPPKRTGRTRLEKSGQYAFEI